MTRSWMQKLLDGETLVSEEKGRAILRCGSCKNTGTVAFRKIGRTTLRSAQDRPRTSVVVVIDGETRERALDTRRSDPVGWALYRSCPCGSNKVTVKVVKGSVASTACDDRCMGATGPLCSCACGGENHGGAHGAFA